jgi:hypothetical protein
VRARGGWRSDRPLTQLVVEVEEEAGEHDVGDDVVRAEAALGVDVLLARLEEQLSES